MGFFKKFKKINFLLLLIFILALFLRLYKLSEIPTGFHRDEASIGYNAYCLLKTGRDEWGSLLPLHLKAFGDWPPAFYYYLTAISIHFFGLNYFAVRFPAALFGSLSIFLIYLFIKILFKNEKKNHFLGLIAAFLLAITPWHLVQSRTSSETAVSLFFLLLGSWGFFQFIEKKKKYGLIVQAFCWLAAYFTYHSYKISLPLLTLIFIGVFWNEISKIKQAKRYLLFWLILISIPFILLIASQNVSERARFVNLFNSSQVKNTIGISSNEDYMARKYFSINPWEMKLIHNNLAQGLLAFTTNYLTYFSTPFLFISGGKPLRYQIPHQGLFYFWIFPLFIFGLFQLLKKNKKIATLFILWLLIIPLISAATFEDHPHTKRTLEILIPIIIFSSFGLKEFLELKILIRIRTFLIGLFLIISGLSLFYFWHQYKIHTLFSTIWARSYGYKQLVNQINYYLKEENYQKAVISSVADEAYIFFLFHNQYPPEKYQQIAKTLPEEISYITWGFDNLVFSTDSCPLEKDKNIIFVGMGGMCHGKIENITPLYTIFRPDKSPVFEFYSFSL